MQVSSWPTDLPEGYGHREKVAVASSTPHVPDQTQRHEATGKDCCESTGAQARRIVSSRPDPQKPQIMWEEACCFGNERSAVCLPGSAGRFSMNLNSHGQQCKCSDWFCINWEREIKKKRGRRERERGRAAGTLPRSTANQSSQQWWIREQDWKFYRYMKPQEYKDTIKTLPLNSSTEGLSRPPELSRSLCDCIFFITIFYIHIYEAE